MKSVKMSLFVLPELLLSICILSACERPHGSPLMTHVTTAVTPDACTVALATGQDHTPRDRAIADAQREARNADRARNALERLGYLYVARARVNSDAGDYTLAQAAADCLNATRPDDAAALLLKGHVLHQLHRFHEAERIARTLVARRTMALDYGLLGDVLMEQGKLDEASTAYQTMIDLKPFYQSYTRAAHLRWLKGDLDGAVEGIRLAIGAASPRDPESAAWAWTRLSAYELQAGRTAAAAAAAETALRHQHDYPAALLAQGRALLAASKVSDALVALRRAVELNPLPEYQWMLADALRLDGLDAEAAAVEQALRARGSAADPRTTAVYLATRRTDLPRALALAEAELRERSDVFTLDAHAWALVATGRVAAASTVMERALAAGTKDARLFLHAGVIDASMGRTRRAKGWLQKAEGLRAMLTPSESAELTRQLTSTTVNQSAKESKEN